MSLDSGEIEATLEHPFWVVDKGWVPAGDLASGDALLGRDGGLVVVIGTTLNAEPMPVFNLSIAEVHTYYAGTEQVLVHNICATVRTLKGYKYGIDRHGRTVSAEASSLRRGSSHKRNTYLQANAGGPDRVSTDNGGHLFAHMFDPDEHEINLVAMDAWLNRGKGSPWAQMERDWKKAIDGNQGLWAKIDVTYPDGDPTPPTVAVQRPSAFRVVYRVGTHLNP